MLELRSLSVNYGPVVAVDSVDLAVASGEVVALLGPNGAGKTSLLRAIVGCEPSDGEVWFDGERVGSSKAAKLPRRGLILVPEGRRLFGNLSVRENLQVGMRAANGRKGWTVDEVFDLFPNLARFPGRSAWMLSGGEQQMVAVGRALVAAPRLLLLDEPSLGLAPVVVQAVYKVLAIVAETTPMLIVEQNTSVAMGIADRVLVLSGGQLALGGTAAEMARRTDLVDSYLGHRTARAG